MRTRWMNGFNAIINMLQQLVYTLQRHGDTEENITLCLRISVFKKLIIK